MKETIKELQTTGRTVYTDTQGSSDTTYMLETRIWLKEILDAAKKRLFFTQFVYTTQLSKGQKDVVIPKRTKYLGSSGISYATSTPADGTPWPFPVVSAHILRNDCHGSSARRIAASFALVSKRTAHIVDFFNRFRKRQAINDHLVTSVWFFSALKATEGHRRPNWIFSECQFRIVMPKYFFQGQIKYIYILRRPCSFLNANSGL